MAEPLCGYFGRCGGCTAQNIDYPLQVSNKRDWLAREIKYEDIELFSDEEYYYRTRVDMVFHEGGLGFRRKGRWDRIVDIGQCVIANQKINSLVTEVREYFKGIDYFEMRKNSGTYRYAVIRAPGEQSSISFTLNADSSRLLAAREKITQYAESASAENIVITYVPHNHDSSISEDYLVVKGRDTLTVELLGKEFEFNVQGFYQNNDRMSQKMQSHVRNILQRYDTAGRHLVDLYGGVGTFGIVNSDLFRQVTIIESFPGAIESARKNIEANGAANTSALELDAKRLKNAGLKAPLIVLTDPPRSGMNPKTIVELNHLRPELLIYVSCNIRQLGADLEKFKEFEIRSAALFDFFPHTPHCEAVVELVPGKPQELPAGGPPAVDLTAGKQYLWLISRVKADSETRIPYVPWAGVVEFGRHKGLKIPWS